MCKESHVQYPRTVDFAIGLLKSVLNVPDGQMNFFRTFRFTEEL